MLKNITLKTEALEKTSNELQSKISFVDTKNLREVNVELLEEMKIKLSKFARSTVMQSIEDTIQKELLDQFYNENSEVEAIWANRLDGTFIYSNPPAGLVNAKARPWFIEASKGNIYVSDVYHSAVTKKFCITISAPMVDQDQITGVIGIDISLQNKEGVR